MARDHIASMWTICWWTHLPLFKWITGLAHALKSGYLAFTFFLQGIQILALVNCFQLAAEQAIRTYTTMKKCTNFLCRQEIDDSNRFKKASLTCNSLPLWRIWEQHWSPQILSSVQVMRSVAKDAKYGTNNVQLHVSHNILRYGATIISFSWSCNDLLQRYFEGYLELAMLAHCWRVSGELLQLELGNT